LSTAQHPLLAPSELRSGRGVRGPRSAPRRDIIVVGASAGGVEALTGLLAALPADLPAAVFVVLHVSSRHTSVLPAILNRAGPLRAVVAAEGETIAHRRVYVAPPGLHLLVERGTVRLGAGVKEHASRPAVDPLFRSAAEAYGPRVAAAVLSGTLNDGATGIAAVSRAGGVVYVQSPSQAQFPEMPRNAIAGGSVNRVLSLESMAAELVRGAVGPRSDVDG
jgi:two-component system, chemotaxis family, protein-glutamate methylesterase/glutaminase